MQSRKYIKILILSLLAIGSVIFIAGVVYIRYKILKDKNAQTYRDIERNIDAERNIDIERNRYIDADIDIDKERNIQQISMDFNKVRFLTNKMFTQPEAEITDKAAAIMEVLNNLEQNKITGFWHFVKALGNTIDSRYILLKEIADNYRQYETRLLSIDKTITKQLIANLANFIYHEGPQIPSEKIPSNSVSASINITNYETRYTLLKKVKEATRLGNIFKKGKCYTTGTYYTDSLIFLKGDKNTCFLNTSLHILFNIPEIFHDLKTLTKDSVESVKTNFIASLNSRNPEKNLEKDVKLMFSKYRKYSLDSYLVEDIFNAIEHIRKMVEIHINRNNQVNYEDAIDTEKMEVYDILNKRHGFHKDNKHELSESNGVYKDIYSMFCFFYNFAPEILNGNILHGKNVITLEHDVQCTMHLDQTSSGPKLTFSEDVSFGATNIINTYREHRHIHFCDIIKQKYTRLSIPVEASDQMGIGDIIKYLCGVKGLDEGTVCPLLYSTENKNWSCMLDSLDSNYTEYKGDTLVFYHIPFWCRDQNGMYFVEVEPVKRDKMLQIPLFFTSLMIKSVELTNYKFSDTGKSAPSTNNAIKDLAKMKSAQPIVLSCDNKSILYCENLYINTEDDDPAKHKNNEHSIECGTVMSSTYISQNENLVMWTVKCLEPCYYNQIQLSHPYENEYNNATEDLVTYDLKKPCNGLMKFRCYSINLNDSHYYALLRPNSMRILDDQAVKFDGSRREKLDTEDYKIMSEHNCLDIEKSGRKVEFCIMGLNPSSFVADFGFNGNILFLLLDDSQ